MKKYIILLLLFSAALIVRGQWINQVILPKPPPLISVHALSIDVGWVSGDSGAVYYTSNGGTVWNRQNLPGVTISPVFSIHATGISSAVCISNVSGVGKIFHTSNAGGSWSQVFSRSGVKLNDVEFMNPNTGFVYGDPVNNFWYILKTTNGGLTFDSTSVNRPPAISGSDFGFPNSQYVIDNSGIGYIWFGTSASMIYRSQSSGTSWNNFPTPGNPLIFSITFGDVNSGFCGGINNAYISTSGGNIWNVFNGAPGAGQFLAFNNIGGRFWYARGNGIYFAPSFGTSFVSQHFSPDNSIYTHLSFAFSPADAMSTIVGWGVTSNGVVSKYSATVGLQQTGTIIPDRLSLHQNYPNPFNPVTHFEFRVPAQLLVSIRIFDVLGKEVSTIVNGSLQPGIYEAEWDAANYPAGVYYCKLIADNYSETKKMVLVK